MGWVREKEPNLRGERSGLDELELLSREHLGGTRLLRRERLGDGRLLRQRLAGALPEL